MIKTSESVVVNKFFSLSKHLITDETTDLIPDLKHLRKALESPCDKTIKHMSISIGQFNES